MAKNRKDKPRLAASTSSSLTRSGLPFSKAKELKSASDAASSPLDLRPLSDLLDASGSHPPLSGISQPTEALTISHILKKQPAAWSEVKMAIENHVNNIEDGENCCNEFPFSASAEAISFAKPAPSSKNASVSFELGSSSATFVLPAPANVHSTKPFDPSNLKLRPVARADYAKAAPAANSVENGSTVLCDSKCLPNPEQSNWTSLFTKLPKNAGSYIPRSFEVVMHDNVYIPPIEVVQEGVSVWSEYLVGFFLDSTAPYEDVHDSCKRIWKPRGSLKVQHFNSMFYFKFGNVQDKMRALELSPLVIDDKPFIITPWSLGVDKAREQILSIPVWATFTNIPSVLQPLIGINWLASLIGELKCFDENTEPRRNLMYARALIEISPTRALPSKLKVRLDTGNEVEIDVQYKWKPKICVACQSFGHPLVSCKIVHMSSPPAKVPLPKQPLKWVPKILSTKPDVTENPIEPELNVKANPNETEKESNSSSDEEEICWDEEERAWVHFESEMRYNLELKQYYLYVGEENESRALYYQIEGDGLTLSTTGAEGLHNLLFLFLDASWDRKYLYFQLSRSFDPSLANAFSEVIGRVGDGSLVREDSISTI